MVEKILVVDDEREIAELVALSLYAAGIDELQSCAEAGGYTFDVILEDPEAEELWAKEIRICKFDFS